MKLNQNDEIYLKIYSIDHLLKCKITEISDKIIKLATASGKVDMFVHNAPTVLVFYENKQLETLPADVEDIDKSSGIVTLKLPGQEIGAERRLHERYPASLIVSARKKYSNKRLELIAKNISMYGMGVISKNEFAENEQVDLDLITEKNMFYISGMILWKKPLDDLFEYGLQLTHFDIATKRSLEEYLSRLKIELANMIPKAR